jgi:hypothetical protein
MKKIVALLFALFFVFQVSCLAFPSNENIVRQGAANLQKNIEPVKGKLYLTETKLIFEAHGLNVQRGTTHINLKDIAVVEKGWSKLLGIVPVVPNALKITMKDGKVYRFTCYWPSRWKDAVKKQMEVK